MTKYSGGNRANNESTALAKVYIVSVTSEVQGERLLEYVRHILRMSYSQKIDLSAMTHHRPLLDLC